VEAVELEFLAQGPMVTAAQQLPAMIPAAPVVQQEAQVSADQVEQLVHLDHTAEPEDVLVQAVQVQL
jgi:hypothetical protein